MFSRILCCLLGLIPLWVFGIIHLPHPFDGDQALFMVGAKTIEAGGRLYIDFWDNKQPGIYLFYWLGGKAFGFHEMGVHTLELLWYSLLAIWMTLGLRPYFQRPWLAAFVPLATVALFYGISDKWHLTQVEALVALPLFGCFWYTARLDTSDSRPFANGLGAGLCAGILVTFKLALAPFAVALWAVSAAVRLFREGRRALMPLLIGLFGATCGGVFILALVALLFAHHGSLSELIWTTFIYPREALATSRAASLSRLLGSVAWFASHTFPLLLLAITSLLGWRGWRREAVTLSLFVTLAAGFAVILIQRWSWWQYHFCLLLVPLGILALRGIDVILGQGSGWKAAVAATALALTLLGPALPEQGMKTLAFLQEYQRHTPWLHEYQRAIDPEEKRIWQDTEFLRNESAKDPIYVFGNPLYLYLSGRAQAMPEHGWSWETYLPSQWASLPEKLEKAKPMWLYLEVDNAGMIADHSPATRALIDEWYEPTTANAAGTWYHRKVSAAETR